MQKNKMSQAVIYQYSILTSWSYAVVLTCANAGRFIELVAMIIYYVVHGWKE